MPMASLAGRRLAELLQEQQEAFLLDVYLLENGYSGRIMCPEATATCWPAGTACRGLQRLASHGFQRRGEGILGSLVGLFARRRPPKDPICRRGAPKDGRTSPSRTGRKARSTREDGGELGKIKVDAGRAHGWECTDEAKELSPVSVLELQSDDGSPANDHPKEEEPSTSGLHAQVGAMEALGGLFHGSASSSHMGTRKKSHARRQTLSACLKEGEVEEERSHQDLHQSSGSRRRGKARRRQVWRAGDDMAAASHLTEPDVPDYSMKRNQFNSHVMEIGAEVGDAILDELIEDLVLTHI